MQPSKPWYTSKTLWSMFLGLVVYIVKTAFSFDIPDAYIVGAMAVLGGFFRWTADSTLTASGPAKP